MIGDDTNVVDYVSRRQSKGFPTMEQGSLYDIVTNICDHELAQIITLRMKKHTNNTPNEPFDSQEPGKSQGAHPETNKPRQSLAHYYLAHPTHTYTQYESGNASQKESQAEPDDDKPKKQTPKKNPQKRKRSSPDSCGTNLKPKSKTTTKNTKPRNATPTKSKETHNVDHNVNIASDAKEPAPLVASQWSSVVGASVDNGGEYFVSLGLHKQ